MVLQPQHTLICCSDRVKEGPQARISPMITMT